MALRTKTLSIVRGTFRDKNFKTLTTGDTGCFRIRDKLLALALSLLLTSRLSSLGFAHAPCLS